MECCEINLISEIVTRNKSDNACIHKKLKQTQIDFSIKGICKWLLFPLDFVFITMQRTLLTVELSFNSS